ncbi:MAG: 3-phosphoshikimate 1-carboxyvinyltransferase [Candidatus Fimadaptatus sp.]
MNMRIIPGALSGRIDDIISSKSQAHRLLICALRADAPTRIRCNSTSRDIQATRRCISALGAQVTQGAGTLDVEPASGACAPGALLDCGESGSTLRFMLPVAGALGCDCAFTGQGLLAQRPLSPLYEQLAAHGMTLSPQGAFPLTARGRLRPGRFEIAGNVSSQFITGLLLALPGLPEESEIHVIGRLESEPYVNITLDALSAFGVRVERTDAGYRVPGGQRFRSPGEVTVEGDWSSAAFWLTAGALGGAGVECAPLRADSAQGDRAIADMLAAMGADVTRGADSVSVRPGALHGVDVDMRDTPDLVPIAAVAAGFARGDTRIAGVERLRLKESDRVVSVLALLNSLGVEAHEQGGVMTIRGRGGFTGGTVDAFGDHRIAMAAAIAGSVADGEVTILGAQASDKSYPGFFDKFAALGGRAEEE